MASSKRTALIVEDDEIQRAVAALLLEDNDLEVLQCDTAEAASRVLDDVGSGLCLMFTDVNLVGSMNGVELARVAKEKFPALTVIVTSGNVAPELPTGATFLQKSWRAADLVREAHLACPASKSSNS
jgi:DNA-binding NtrC family response regulator